MHAVEQAIRHADWLRRSPAHASGRGSHKEWLHFCVYAPGIDVLVNLSLLDDVRSTAPRPGEFARVTLLVRERHWDGEVNAFAADEVEIEAGRIAMRFGPNMVRFDRGAYSVAAQFRD